MNELIAKKYVQALYKTLDSESLENAAEIFEALSNASKDEKISAVLNDPQVSKEKKQEIILLALKDANSNEINNLIKLLVENGRLGVFYEIAKGLKKVIADSKKSYCGVVYSDTEIESSILSDLGNGLGKKFDSAISLSYKKSDFDGIKVDVEDLGIEISFSKTRINKQIVEHILKAI